MRQAESQSDHCNTKKYKKPTQDTTCLLQCGVSDSFEKIQRMCQLKEMACLA